MLSEFIVIAIAVAGIASLAVAFANKYRPQHSIQRLIGRVTSWLVLGTLLLMALACARLAQFECAPDDTVCDAPAMAAAGIMFLGGMILAAIILIGMPVAYGLLKLLRRK